MQSWYKILQNLSGRIFHAIAGEAEKCRRDQATEGWEVKISILLP